VRQFLLRAVSLSLHDEEEFVMFTTEELLALLVALAAGLVLVERYFGRN
jgi:hypothetical protein